LPGDLTAPARFGALALRNRVVMAPMTRSRALADGRAHASARQYYAQRASAGMIVTEGTSISQEAVGAPGVPGIWTRRQMAAWRPVTEAVHERGGTIVLQLWHTGRASHPAFQPRGAPQPGPSAVAIRGRTYTPAGWAPCEPPRAMSRAEILQAVLDYAAAGRNALASGFDGVELHGANGYLIDQFLHASSNRRTDAYGGSVANRARFLFEVVESVAAGCGSERVGLRLSPSSSLNDMDDPEREELFDHVLAGLAPGTLAYLHVVEPGISGAQSVETPGGSIDSAWVRERWTGSLVATGGYTRESAEHALRMDRVDAAGFGRLFISNPDLPERLFAGAPLAEPVRATYYGGGDEGYVDYPAWREPARRALGAPTCCSAIDT
jgi:N-ethylmaleimide reductase